MQTVPAVETLKTGERLTIECVMSPNSARAAQIRPFLAHKPPHYREHVEAALNGQCDSLETRFYIGLLDEEMAGNIMTVETGGVGLFGHVHTRQDQRRKGICDAIMRHQMEDFRQRGGHVLLLGTGYQSPAYRIYERHGFRDWTVGKPGWMRYDSEPEGEFETRFFAPSRYTPAAARWRHWPLVALLASVPTSACLQSLTFKLWGVGLLEGAYCQFLHHAGQHPEIRAGVLESETGAVVAMASCVPDDRWPGIMLLDLFAHPVVGREDLARLLASLHLPDSAVQCYSDPRDIEKMAALEQCGFRRSALLPGQYLLEETRHDVWLYART